MMTEYAKRHACVALSVVLCAAPAIAQEVDFSGVYRQGETGACAKIGVDGGAIQIENDVFSGVESECRMTRPVNVVDMNAMLFDMKCSGEGNEWEARAMFMKSADDGLIMVWDGYAFQYARCAAADLAPAATDAPAADADEAEAPASE